MEELSLEDLEFLCEDTNMLSSLIMSDEFNVDNWVNFVSQLELVKPTRESTHEHVTSDIDLHENVGLPSIVKESPICEMKSSHLELDNAYLGVHDNLSCMMREHELFCDDLDVILGEPSPLEILKETQIKLGGPSVCHITPISQVKNAMFVEENEWEEDMVEIVRLVNVMPCDNILEDDHKLNFCSTNDFPIEGITLTSGKDPPLEWSHDFSIILDSIDESKSLSKMCDVFCAHLEKINLEALHEKQGSTSFVKKNVLKSMHFDLLDPGIGYPIYMCMVVRNVKCDGDLRVERKKEGYFDPTHAHSHRHTCLDYKKLKVP